MHVTPKAFANFSPGFEERQPVIILLPDPWFSFLEPWVEISERLQRCIFRIDE